jgi:Tol biopolymer transport system component
MSAQPLPGTEDASAPFWSPDSKFLGFFADGKLKRIDPSGGSPQVVCDAAPVIQGGAGGGGSWNRDGVIVFGSLRARHLQRVSAAGGEPSRVTTLDANEGENLHLWPVFLPDGRHFLYQAIGGKTRGAFAPAGVYVGSLDSNARTLVIPGGSNAQYAQGFLTFLRGSTLMAQPFDAARLSATSDAVPIVDQVFTGGVAAGAFSVSDTGVLAYETEGSGDVHKQLTWFDRNGKEVGTLGEQDDYLQLRLSPDGQRAAVTIPDPVTRTTDIWIFDVARGLRTRFTFDPSDDFGPVWSPDATRLAFSRRTPRADIYQKASSGAGGETVLLADSRLNGEVVDWSSDGQFLSYTTTGTDLGILPLAGDRKPRLLLQSNFANADGQFSPDGHWMAYTSLESGTQQVYVTPFPGPGGKWQISPARGESPRWRRDGTELFYFSPGDTTLMVASVNGQGSAFEVGSVRSLFKVTVRRDADLSAPYDVSADGQRFLVNKAVEHTPASASITLIVNWPALLKK